MLLMLLRPAGKWARGGWAASDEDEKRIKEETQVRRLGRGGAGAAGRRAQTH